MPCISAKRHEHVFSKHGVTIHVHFVQISHHFIWNLLSSCVCLSHVYHKFHIHFVKISRFISFEISWVVESAYRRYFTFFVLFILYRFHIIYFEIAWVVKPVYLTYIIFYTLCVQISHDFIQISRLVESSRVLSHNSCSLLHSFHIASCIIPGQ